MPTRDELRLSGDLEWATLESGLSRVRIERAVNPHVIIQMQVPDHAMAMKIWQLLDADEHTMVCISWMACLSKHTDWIGQSITQGSDEDKDLGDTFCAQCGTSMLRDKRGGLVVAHECAR